MLKILNTILVLGVLLWGTVLAAPPNKEKILDKEWTDYIFKLSLLECENLTNLLRNLFIRRSL